MALRTLNYQKVKSQISEYRPMIICDSFRTLSTGTLDHHEFYRDVTDIGIGPTKEKTIVTCCSPLYQQVSTVFIQLPIISTMWSTLWNISKNNIHWMFD